MQSAGNTQRVIAKISKVIFCEICHVIHSLNIQNITAGAVSRFAMVGVAFAVNEATVLTDSVSQYGIIWKFQNRVAVGKFVNGDSYVVGPVTVTSVTPSPSGTGKEFRNGSMLNPPVTAFNGYDGRIPQGFRQELAAKFPLEMKPGDSLVSIISLDAKNSHKPEAALGGYSDHNPVTAAVLTCLKAPVPPDAFRPGYCDQKKDVIHRASEIHWERIPSTIALAAATNKPPRTWMEMERVFERPWLDHVYGWESVDIHPADNMPGYSREVARIVSLGALFLCSDAPKDQKTKLCQGMIQVGLDNWAIAKRGKVNQAGGWPAAGGYGNGRKFPIVFAAVALQDPEMLQINKNAPETAFGEDQHTVFGCCWTGASVCFAGQFPLCGSPERGPYEHLWPGLWPGIGPTGKIVSENYRRGATSSTWLGEALAVRLMKAEKVWDHDAFFAYVDRWMYEDDTEQRRILKNTLIGADFSDYSCHGCAVFNEHFFEEMWKSYRQGSGMPTVAFKGDIVEEGTVKIGANREFVINDKKVFPLIFLAQAQAQIQNVSALGADVVKGIIPSTVFAQADGQVQDALAIGANTVFVNGDAGETTWAFHYGKEFMNRIAAKGLYGVIGADTEVFGYPNLLGLTHEDQPDRAAASFGGAPKPKQINVTLNVHSGGSAGWPRDIVGGDKRLGAFLDPMKGAEVTIKVERPVTVSSFVIWLNPNDSNSFPKETVFLVEGKEILKAVLEKKKGKQEFKLEKPVVFKELLFRVVSDYPGPKIKFGAGGNIAQLEAFDEKGNQVWLYDYDPQVHPVEKVADAYGWMKKMQKTRPVFLTLSSGFLPSSTMWDKETRQSIYPGYLKNADVAGFVLSPDSSGNMGAWLNRASEGVTELGRLAGPGKPIVFWVDLTTGVTASKTVIQSNQIVALKPEQVRAAVWDAIIHGTTAIGYRLPQEKNQTAMDEQMKTELKHLNERITSLAPALLGNPARAKVEMTIGSGLQCPCKATESDGLLFIFAQNIGMDTTRKVSAGEPLGGRAMVRVEGLQTGTRIEVVGEGRTITASSGSFSDDFAPLAEHVYRLVTKQ